MGPVVLAQGGEGRRRQEKEEKEKKKNKGFRRRGPANTWVGGGAEMAEITESEL